MKDIKNVLYLLMSFLILSCTESTSQQTKEAETSQSSQAVFTETKPDRPVILFFGNSITKGYGLDPENAFSSLIQARLDSLGYHYLAINAGLSGETTASGLSRVDWVLKTVPEIFVLELGGNDGLRGIDTEETHKNLIQIIASVREVNPDVKILLAGMEVPPSMGEDYAGAFRKIYPAIRDSEQVSLIPFILDKVAGEPELNLPDGIHPTEEGHRIVSNTVWKYLQPLLTPPAS
ncbi:MAG: arylesterase [Bacteroidota bacterium]